MGNAGSGMFTHTLSTRTDSATNGVELFDELLELISL